jgi:hypothetical protein
MAKPPACDLIQEKGRLFAALNAVHRYWGTAEMVPAYERLLHAIARAERALALSPPCNESEGMTLRLQVRSVAYMLPYALYEVMRLEIPKRPKSTLTKTASL